MKQTDLSGRDLASALAVVVIWGTNFLAMKVALHDFTPFQLGAARYVFAVLPLVVLVKPPRMPWKWVVAYGAVQGVGQFGFLFLALTVGMTAALASVLVQTQVFFTAIFGFFVLGERASRPLQIGLLLASAGLVCFGANYVGAGGHAAPGATGAAGFLLCLASAVMWAASNIVVRLVQRTSPDFDVVAFMVWSSLTPILPFIALSLLFDPPASRMRWTAAPWGSWFAVAFLGWVATIIAYAVWNGLFKRHPVNRVAPFSLGVPVVGLSTGMLVLGETVNAWQWAGTALVVSALASVLLGPRLMRR